MHTRVLIKTKRETDSCWQSIHDIGIDYLTNEKAIENHFRVKQIINKEKKRGHNVFKIDWYMA